MCPRNFTTVSYRTSGTLFLFLVLPTKAFASDYTAFFFLFMEIPVLVISLLFLVVCFFAPKVGVVLMALLFGASLFILNWASEVGYMSTAGELLLISLVIDLIGIVTSVKKINDAKKLNSDKDT